RRVMQLLSLRLDFSRVFDPGIFMRVPFSFSAPIDGAYALLQGFSLTRDHGDGQVSDFIVSLQARMLPQSRTAGEVEVELSLPRPQGLEIASKVVGVELAILVVGV